MDRGRRDAFTGKLATHAANNGYLPIRLLHIYKHYDLPRAVVLAGTAPSKRDPGDNRLEALCAVIGEFARLDPDAALALAEKEEDEGTRRELIDIVSRVLAVERPEQIERALRDQDNAVRRGWARTAANEELTRRAAGRFRQPPPAFRPKTSSEPRAAGRSRASPEVTRVLDDPGNTKWLVGPNRERFLQLAAVLSLREPGGLDAIDRLVAGLSDQNEIDAALSYAAGQADPRAIGATLTLLGRVKSDPRFVGTACAVARNLVR